MALVMTPIEIVAKGKVDTYESVVYPESLDSVNKHGARTWDSEFEDKSLVLIKAMKSLRI